MTAQNDEVVVVGQVRQGQIGEVKVRAGASRAYRLESISVARQPSLRGRKLTRKPRSPRRRSRLKVLSDPDPGPACRNLDAKLAQARRALPLERFRRPPHPTLRAVYSLATPPLVEASGARRPTRAAESDPKCCYHSDPGVLVSSNPPSPRTGPKLFPAREIPYGTDFDMAWPPQFVSKMSITYPPDPEGRRDGRSGGTFVQ
jgi:hypothetical protein